MIGHHLLIDLFECDNAVTNNLDYIKETIQLLSDFLEAKILEFSEHSFSPHGITSIAIISTSHISIHTWPEKSFVAVDIFSCSSFLNQRAISDLLRSRFIAQKITISQVLRGIENSQPV